MKQLSQNEALDQIRAAVGYYIDFDILEYAVAYATVVYSLILLSNIFI